MKQRPKKLHEVQEEYNDAVVGLCLNCGHQTKAGWYGQFEGGGVCSKSCNTAQMAKPRYEGHDEAQFLKKFNL